MAIKIEKLPISFRSTRADKLFTLVYYSKHYGQSTRGSISIYRKGNVCVFGLWWVDMILMM
jgi:hypothetical protein